jgi:hypothetical protein
MVSTVEHGTISSTPFTFVDSEQFLTQMLSFSAVTIADFATFDRRLIERRLVPYTKVFSPLWVLAEGERNLYLWRAGISLSQLDRYRFLLSPRDLIRKRSAHLQKHLELLPSEENDSLQSSVIMQELKYLDACDDLLKVMQYQLVALSAIGLALEREKGPFRMVFLN